MPNPRATASGRFSAPAAASTSGMAPPIPGTVVGVSNPGAISGAAISGGASIFGAASLSGAASALSISGAGLSISGAGPPLLLPDGALPYVLNRYSLGIYKISFYFEAFVHEPIILVLPPRTCTACTIARLTRVYWTV